MRCVIARVLPVPAPARMQTGPRTACAAARCSGSSPASTRSAASAALPGSVTSSILPAAYDTSGNGVPVAIVFTIMERATVTPLMTMYTTSWCGFCRRLKSQLQREGIDYAEVDIERDETAAEFVMSVNNGNQTVPTLVFADGTALTNPSVSQVKAQ